MRAEKPLKINNSHVKAKDGHTYRYEGWVTSYEITATVYLGDVVSGQLQIPCHGGGTTEQLQQQGETWVQESISRLDHLK